uniref:Uncharacterized protein n=1 Tax=Romanomermis culicivorax TaxID=13658 RepID=A0A915I9K8_ROMCU
MLEILSEKCFKFHCLDLYPFNAHLPLRKLFVRYPDLHALTLKPHGAEYFWNGMPLSHFPEDSRKLESLIIDSINIAENVVLPPTLTYLEWTHRDDTKFFFFINKLCNCPKLNYLSISHVFMHELSQRILFDFFEHLPELMYLTFKFVRFTKPLTGSAGESNSPKNNDHVLLKTDQKINNDNDATNTSVDEKFVGLKVLKFDLCY